MKFLEVIKKRPKTVAATVFVIGVILIIFVARRGGGAQVVYANGIDPQSTVQLAAIQAQAEAAQSGNIAAMNVAQMQITGALEAKRIEAEAAKYIIGAQTGVANKQIDAQVQVITDDVGTMGVSGIVHNKPLYSWEVAGRQEGYGGAFGQGGLQNFVIAKYGVEGARQWYTNNGYSGTLGF